MRLFITIFLATLCISLYSVPFISHADDSAADAPIVEGCEAQDDAGDPPACGLGTYQQECSYMAGVEDCENVFTLLPPTPEEDFAPTKQGLFDGAALNISALWNDTPLVTNATSSIPLNTQGALSILIAPNGGGVIGHGRGAPLLLSDVLGTAVLTVGLYQGDVGSSTLLYAQTVSSSSPFILPSTFFPSSGSYFLAYSATYPDGTYAPGQRPADVCSSGAGDFCSVPAYSLVDFETVLTSGINENENGSLGNYRPAAYGILPFLVEDAPTPSPTGPKASNVLFIPGTLTSRLYMRNSDGSERDLWEPRSNVDVVSLAMGDEGVSLNQIYTRDIIDEDYSNNDTYHPIVKFALGDIDVYGSFEKFMNGLVSDGTIKEWRAYPYDWRYDVRDIVANGTLVGSATSTPTTVYIQDVVQQLASSSPTGKVTIVAHSNGGLIAKALMIDLESKGKANLVDKIIMVGTPQFGTPKAITDLLHGDEFTSALGILMYSDTVRHAEATMPGVYDLLPSVAYFSHTNIPVATFDENQPAKNFQDALGATITSVSQLSDFLSDTFNLDSSAGIVGSTKTPIPLSSALIQKAEATHDALDVWTPPNGVDVTSIAGWGQLTPVQESYSGTNGLNCERTTVTSFDCNIGPQLQPSIEANLDGDDTVVSESGIGNIGNQLFFNSRDFQKKTKNHIVHKSLLSAEPIQSILKDTFTNSTSSEEDILSSRPTESAGPLTVVSAHSPVNLLTTDSDGNQTGIIPIPELPGIYFEKEDIPGSSIQVVGEEKYLYLPSGTDYSVSMQGYTTGTTTIDVDSLDSSGVITHLQEFPNIPTTASTSALFSVSASGSTTSNLPSVTETTASTIPTQDTTQTSGFQMNHVAQIITATSSPKYSLIHFSEETTQPGTLIHEMITALISIVSSAHSWTMYSTIFIKIIPY